MEKSIDRLETISFDYLSREYSFLKMNVIFPLLFIIGQMSQFLIIMRNRKILPPEVRGFIVITIIVLLIFTNIYFYYRFKQNVEQYYQSPQLFQLIDNFNRYKKRVSRTYYSILALSITYVIVYFLGFILLLLQITQPKFPELFPPFIGILMKLLISITFILQVIYLIFGWKHIERWRESEKKLIKYEQKMIEELDIST